MDRQQAFLAHYRQRRRFVRCIQILTAVLFFGLWEATTRLHILDAFIFSSPSRVLTTFIDMARDGTVFYHIGVTLYETLLSFAIVLILGTGIAVILWWNRKAAAICEPYLVVLNSLPKTALAPILIVWLGNNMKTIIVCAVSLAIFNTVIHLYTCFSETDGDKLLLIRTLGGGKKEILSKVILPGSIPSLISNMKANIGLCLVGVIIGEFLAANAGIGYLIIYGSQVFKLSWVIMSIVLLCFIAVGLYALIGLLEKIYQKRL